jgi:hypothetical protein
MSPAVVAWVEATRSRQGLPARVTDEQVLDQVAAILTGASAPVEVEGEADAVAS